MERVLTPEEAAYWQRLLDSDTFLQRGVSAGRVADKTGILRIPRVNMEGDVLGDPRKLFGATPDEMAALRPDRANYYGFKINRDVKPEYAGDAGYFLAEPGQEEIWINPLKSQEEQDVTEKHEMTHADQYISQVPEGEGGTSPEDAAQDRLDSLNSLDSRIKETTDPTERARLEDQYRTLRGTSPTELYFRNPGEMLANLSSGERGMAKQLNFSQSLNPHINKDKGLFERVADAVTQVTLADTTPHMTYLQRKNIFPFSIHEGTHRGVPIDVSKAIVGSPPKSRGGAMELDRDKAIRAAKLTAKQVSSHKAADRVAELLRQGRAKEVTNDLMDQADPQRLHHHYVSGNTGVDMPMDQASRMERAAQMGFDTKAYHGTNTSQEFSSLGKSVNSKRRESYLAPEEHKEFSNSFASSDQGRVFPLLANVTGFHNGRTEEGREALKDLAYEKNFQPELYANHLKGDPNTLRPVSWGDQNAIDKLNDAGYPGAVIEERPWMDSYAVFDPTKLRSQFARFDPRLSHLSHLSASTGGAMELARHATAVGRAGGQVAPSKYLPNVPRAVHADGGKVAFQQGNHPDVPDVMYHGTGAGNDFSSFSMPGNKTGRKTGGNAIYLSTSPDAASTFANYGEKPRVMPLHVSAKNPFDFRNSDHIDSLQGALTKNFKSWFPGAMYGPQTAINWMRGGDFGLLENNNVRSWMKRQGHDSYFVTEGEDKPLNLAVLDPKQVKSAISNNGDFDPTNPDITKADGGPAMFQGIHPELQGEGGAPLDLYHGTTQDKEFEAFDDAKLGARDAGFYGRGHYLTPVKEGAEEYAGDGTVIGPLRAALKNPYIWDLSDEGKSNKTLRDLQSMGIMRDQKELKPWDNLQQHHIQPFMAEMKKRGHDGVIVKTGYEHLPNGISEVVAFDPKTIKHKDAEAFDPTDPRIRREAGGEIDKATGGPVMGYVPMASLTVPRLAVARAPQYQQQAPAARFSESLNSLMDTVEGFKKKPDADAERPVSAPSPSAASEGRTQLGMIAMPEEGYEATGMYAPFQSAIDRMIADAPGKITVASGYRTPERQEELWNEHAAKYPDPEVRDDYVARAGQSSHNYGLAADLSYADQEAIKWAQENAAKYGLNFRMGHENWHIEPANIWELRNAMTVPGYANGGSAMDDDNQDTSGGNNVESLSLARSLRNIGSGGGDDRVQNLFDKIAAGQEQAQKAYEMAHSNGEFDDFKIGDTFVYKHSANPTPIKVTGFSVRRAESFPQGKRVYNNHIPALEMEDQTDGKKVNKVALEWFKDNLHKYDFVSGKPRAVKAGGGPADDDNRNGAMENGNAPINSATRTQAGELPNSGGVRGGAGLLQTQNEAPLEGLPQKIVIPLTGQVIQAGADPRIRQVARDYMAQAGLSYSPPTKYARVDPKRASRIASDYTDMEDNPNDPLTKASYDAMIKETMDQYRAAKKSGLKIEFWNPRKQEDPYKASPRLATEDIRNNHHMWVFPTYSGYGSGEPISEDDAKKNPLLQLTGETWNGIPATVNDVFRAIHDYYGHAKEGLGFRADGEENAWRAHASMFSPLARMAMTSETRGQNSWLNYGPHGEHNRKARTEDTIFAPQKIGVMSHLSHHEGAEDFITPEDISFMASIRSRFGKKLGGAVEKALALTRRFTKDGKSAINALKPKGN
jgi:hypothetical protein